MEFAFRFFETNALRKVLIIALIARLVAVIFAPGYLMHDDHFLTVEPAASWAVGENFNDWLPDAENKRTAPEPISFLYPGSLMVAFKAMHSLGLHDPLGQMWVLRLMHALYSLLTVLLVFKITEKWSNRRNAVQAGLLMALLAIMPNFCVRNLVELVCMPPLMAGFWWLILAKEKVHNQKVEIIGQRCFWWAAVVMGIAVGVRFQLGLAVALVGVILFFQNGWRSFLAFGFVSFATFFLTQIDDVLLWGGRPFQHLLGYFTYNKENALNYPGSPYTYISFIGFYILPPVSLFLLWGFLKTWRAHLLMSVPIIAFFLFHIFYPNRQERFLLPALPAFIILGVMGWNAFVSSSRFWIRNPRLLRASYVFFMVVNTLGVVVVSTTYSKKARVQAMYYLYQQGDCSNYVLDYTHQEGAAMLPQYYSGRWTKFYYWNNKTKVADVISKFSNTEQSFASRSMPKPVPNYYLFYDGPMLEERIARVAALVPGLHYATTIESGWFDELLHRLNKQNTIERIHIYKTTDQ